MSGRSGSGGTRVRGMSEYMVQVGGNWSLNWRSSWSNRDKGQTCGIS